MIFNLEVALQHAGSSNRFQYFLLAVCTITWFAADFLAISLPIFKDEPTTFICGPNAGQTKICTKHEACLADYFASEYHYWTFLEDTKLLCVDEVITIIGGALAIGLCIGAILFSKLVDLIGRRLSLLLSNTIFAISTVSMLFLNFNIYLVCTWLCFIGITAIGSTISSYLLLIESVDTDSRSFINNGLHLAFPLAGFGYFAVYQFSYNWKTGLFVAIGFNLISSLLVFIYIPETARYFLTKNQFGNCTRAIYRIALFNNRRNDLITYLSYEYKMQMLDKTDETLCSLREELLDSSEEDLSNEDKIAELFSTVDAKIVKDTFAYYFLVTDVKLRTIFFTTSVLWVLSVFVYYGITFHLDKISNNMFVSAYINYAAEFASAFVVTGLFKISYYGRKTNFTIMYGLATISSVPFLFTKNDWIVNGCLFCFRFAIVSAFSTCLLYSSEVFPTEARGKGINMNSLLSRISLMVMAVTIKYLEGQILYWIWIAMSFTNFLNSFLLKETKGRKMLDRVDQLHEDMDD